MRQASDKRKVKSKEKSAYAGCLNDMNYVVECVTINTAFNGSASPWIP